MRRLARTLPVPAAALLGAAHASCFAPPFDFWVWPLLALSGLFLLLRHRSTRAQVLLALVFGGMHFATGLRWLYTSMHDFGGMPAALAALAVLVFALYLALFPAGAVALAAHLSPARTSPTLRHDLIDDTRVALALAGAWGLGEILRGWLFTGFPWLAIGYAQIDGPLSGFAPWIGVQGISALTALVAALLACRRAAPVVLAMALLGTGAVLPSTEFTEEAGPPLQARLVQAAIPQSMKFDPQSLAAGQRRHAELLGSDPPALAVFPETAWLVPFEQGDAQAVGQIRDALARQDSRLALGVPLWDRRPDGRASVSNSVVLLQGGQAQVEGRYDKQHLVPFGEFIPWGFRWFVDLMHIPLGDFARGTAAQAAWEVGGQKLAFNVCYEDLFGEEIAAAVRDAGATVLVNVSNLAWFGDSAALHQHLAIARMRSLETARPSLRATNTGATAAIDHQGRVQARLPHAVPGALDVTVQGRRGSTPFVRWGMWLPLALCLLMLAATRAPRLRLPGPENR